MQILEFPTEKINVQNFTNLTVDGHPAQVQVSQYHNGFHTILWFYLSKPFTAKESISMEPDQGLNLNRRPISGLEPEIPVARH